MIDKRKKKAANPAPLIEALEPRILYSADALGAALDIDLQPDPLAEALEQVRLEFDRTVAEAQKAALLNAQQQNQLTPQNSETDSNEAALTPLSPIIDEAATAVASKELVLVDTDTPDYQFLLDDLTRNHSDRNFEVVLLDNTTDGIAQVSAILSNHASLDALHIISHGENGAIDLGNSRLDQQALVQNADAIGQWSSAFSDNGDLLIYGCNLAASSDGEQLVNRLAAITGADVAASDDLTGNAALGGDFDLEYTTGQIEAGVAFSNAAQESFQSVLLVGDGLWLSTSSNATGSGSGGPSLSWGAADIVSLSDPDLAFSPATTDGTFTDVFDLNVFVGDGDANVEGLDYVQQSVNIGSGGGNIITLQAGDVLLSVNDAETLGGVAVTQNDIVLFRPDTPGVFTSGTFSILLQNPTGAQIGDFALVEQTVTVGSGGTAVDLQAGSILTTETGGKDGIDLFVATSAGTGSTSGNLTLKFVDSVDIDISKSIIGLEIVQQSTTLGGVALSEGQLLVSIDTDDSTVGDNAIAVKKYDIFSLNLTATGAGTTAGDAALLLVGADVGISAGGEEFDSIALTGASNVNTAPTITDAASVGLAGTNEDSTSAGTTVTAIVDAAGWSDVDGGAVRGMAITGATGNGTWEYSDDGISWSAIGSVNATNALLLDATSQLRYVGDSQNGEVPTFDFKAWDTTTETASTNAVPSYANPGAGGGTSAFSSESASANLTVTSVNDGPVLDNTALMDLPNVLQNSTDPSGSLVSSIIASAGGNRIDDVDTGAVEGIAVTSVDNTSGAWQYSIDGGSTWVAFGAVTNSTAVVLTDTANDRIRFVPNTDYTGDATFDFRAWDTSDGRISGDAGVDTGSGGTTSAYSAEIENVSITVEPTEIFLWSSTSDDVGPTGGSGGGPASGTPGLANWSDGEIIGLGDPNQSFGSDTTDGTFFSIVDFDSFAADSDVDIAGIHYVTNDITVTGSGISSGSIDLQKGDVIFVTLQGESLSNAAAGAPAGWSNSITTTTGDVFVFRAENTNDYSSGYFRQLMNNPSTNGLTGITLVERATVVGGDTALAAGDFLFAQSGAAEQNDIYWYDTSLNSSVKLIEGDDLGIDSQIDGLHFNDGGQTLGSVSLATGSILISLDQSDTIGSNNKAVAEHDVVELELSATTLGSTNAVASAETVIDGDDIGLDHTREDIDAFTLVVRGAGTNQAPVLGNTNPAVNYTENGAPVLLDTSITLTDADSTDFASGILRIDITAGADINDRIEIYNQGTGSGQVGVSQNSITYENIVIGTFSGGNGNDPLVVSLNSNADEISTRALMRNITFANVSDAPGALTRTIEFTLTDGDGGISNVISQSVNVTEVGDAPIAVPDTFGLDFDGVDDYVAIADSPSLTMSNTLTMEAWINPDASANVNRMIINKEGEYEVALFSDNRIYWAFANSDPGWAWHDTGYTVTNGEWTHVAITYDFGTVSTYVNGTLVEEYNGSGSIGDSHPTLDELRIGGRSNSPDGKYFDGQIDDVRIWNDVRTQAEIQANLNVALVGNEAGLAGFWNFNEGIGTTVTDLANGNDGILTDAAATGAPIWVGYTTDENTQLSINGSNGILSNDVDSDGDALSVSQINGNPANVGVLYELPSTANVTVDAFGAFVYDPQGAFDYLTPGQTATDTFTYQVDDGNGGSDTATVTIKITGVNDAPQLGTGTLSAIVEDNTNPAGETVNAIFAGQFSDVDSGSFLSGVAVIGNNANAVTEGTWQYSTNSGTNWSDIGTVADDNTALAVSGSTLIRFVPVNDYNGVPTGLTVRGLDNTYVAGFSDTAGTETRVNIDTTNNGDTTAIAELTADIDTSITADNDTPTTSGITDFSVPEDTATTTINLQSVFADIEDADSDLLYTIESVSNPGLFDSTSVNASDILILSYAADQNGFADITIRATDTGGEYAETTFRVTVDPVDDDPTLDNAIPDQAATEDSAFSFAFNANTFGDVDAGDTLTYSATLSGGGALPSWLTFNAATRTFSGTPLNADIGTISVEVTADDGNGGTPATDTFDIAVVNSNDDPTVDNAIPDQAATEDTAFSFAFNTNTFGDVDAGDTLTYSATLSGGAPLPTWLTFNAATRTFSGTPLNADVGTISVEVTADDGNGGTPATDTFDIVVSNTNDDPTLDNAIPDQAATEDAAFSFAFNANTFGDVDAGDTLTYSATLSGGGALPSWLSFNAATRTFSGTPLNADVGTISVEVTADDGNGGTPATDTFDIVVANSNDDPTLDNAIPDQAATEDAAFSFAFNANTFGDVDTGDTLTYSATLSGGAPLPGWLTFNAATRTFSGTPLNADVGTISIEVTADDGNGGTPATDTFDIVVSNTNDDPTLDNAIPDQAATEDAAFSFAFNANTFGDVDAGDTLTYSATLSGGGALPSWLSFNAATRTFSGTPLNADVGTISVEVTADDGNGGTPATDTFDIVVANSNDDPTLDNAIPDQAATEDAAFSFAFNANTFGDVDTGDTLTYSATLSGGGALPSWLSFNAATRTFSGTPLNADVGTISVEVTADDGNGGTPATDTFDIVISNTNDDPTVDNAIPDQAATEDAAFSFAFNANTFGDVDTGDTLTYSATLSGGGALPSWLTFNAATRTFSGTPLNADVGTISVEVTADDGNGGTPATDTFDIVVANSNDDPTLDNAIPDQAATEDAAFSFAFNANTFGDVDTGDTLTYSATLSGGAPLPSWLTFNAATRTFSGTPLNADVGTISIEVTADDGNGGTPATDTFDIVVSNTPDAPLIGGVNTGSVTEDVDPDTDGLLEVANALTIADPDAGESSFVAETINGTYGDLVIDAAGNWSYSADNTQAAIQQLDVTEFITDTLTVTTADGTTHDIVITINGAEDAPSVDNPIPDQSTAEDSVYSYTFNANVFGDVDASDTLTYSAQLSGGGALPSWLAFDGNTRNFVGVPLNADVGFIDIEVIADDGTSTISDVFRLTITNTNDTPTIGGDDTGSVTEDVDPDADLLLETSGALTISDPDVGESSFVAGTINGTYGDLVIDASGNWDYSANNVQAAIQGLDVTESITDTLTVTTADGSTHDIVITINGAEDAPVQGGINSGTVAEDGTLVASNTLTISDADVNDNPVSYNDVATTAGDNSYGTFTMSGNTWTYTLDNTHPAVQALDVTESLSDTYTFTATDGSTRTVTITIDGAEDAPVLGTTNTGTVAEDGVLVASDTLTITDVDTSDNPVSFNDQATIAGTNGYGTFEMTGNTWTYTLNNAHASVQALDVTESLTDTFTFTATDGTMQTVTVTIDGAEDAPTLDNAIADQVATEDSAFSFTFNANTFGDVDTSDTLAYTAQLNGGGALPGWLSFNAGTRTFSGTPLNADVGTYSIDVIADDGSSTVTDTFVITVNNTNDAPLIGGIDTGSVTEDIDPDTDGLLEVANALTIADPDTGESSFVAGTIVGTYGDLVIDTAGNWSYSADNTQNEIQSLDNGESVTDTLTVTTFDGSTHDIVITINGAEDAPLQGGGITGTVAEDGTLVASDTLTITDADSNDNPIAYNDQASIAGDNGYGSFALSGNTWTYTLNDSDPAVQALDAGESTTDTFTFTANDGSMQLVTVTINGAEDAPVQGGTSTGTATEDGGAIGNSLTITDVDTSDNPVSYNDVAATAGSYGDFALSGNAWTYTLNNGLAAIQSLDTGDTLSDSFTFSATDGSTQLVTVTINGAEDAPTASDNILSMIQGDTLTLNTADFGFADVDTGDTLASVRITALASAGDLQLAGTSVALNQVITRTDIDAGQLAFVPAPGGSGAGYASFAFSVNDGAVDSTASNTIDIDVTPLPEPEEPEQPPEEPEEPTVDRVTEPEPEPAPEPGPETDPGEIPVVNPVVVDEINKPGIELPQPISGDAAVELALFDDDDKEGASTPLSKHFDLHNLSLSAIDIEQLQLLEYQSLFDNDDFVQALDDLGVTFDKAAAEEQSEYSLGAETRLGIAVSLSAGFVSWVLRAGSLLASVFSVMPLWKQLDPLPVLGIKDEEKSNVDSEQEDEEHTEDESQPLTGTGSGSKISQSTDQLENYFKNKGPGT